MPSHGLLAHLFITVGKTRMNALSRRRATSNDKHSRRKPQSGQRHHLPGLLRVKLAKELKSKVSTESGAAAFAPQAEFAGVVVQGFEGQFAQSRKVVRRRAVAHQRGKARDVALEAVE